MSVYSTIKKEFYFLKTQYGFEIHIKQKSGAYSYITWENSKVRIVTLYDFRIEHPMKILISDVESFGTVYDAIEYKNELIINSKKPKEIIRHAAEWLQNGIKNHYIMLKD